MGAVSRNNAVCAKLSIRPVREIWSFTGCPGVDDTCVVDTVQHDVIMTPVKTETATPATR